MDGDPPLALKASENRTLHGVVTGHEGGHFSVATQRLIADCISEVYEPSDLSYTIELLDLTSHKGEQIP